MGNLPKWHSNSTREITFKYRQNPRSIGDATQEPSTFYTAYFIYWHLGELEVNIASNGHFGPFCFFLSGKVKLWKYNISPWWVKLLANYPWVDRKLPSWNLLSPLYVSNMLNQVLPYGGVLINIAIDKQTDWLIHAIFKLKSTT